MDVVPASRQAAAARTDLLRDELESFLASCRRPAVVEPGEEPLLLDPSCRALTPRPDSVLLEAWDSTRTLARHLVRIVEARPGRLQVAARRFGRGEVRLTLLDLERPQNRAALQLASRDVLKEQFRGWLARQFPGWRLEQITTGADLEHTLSPAYPRALLARGTTRWAALCSMPDASHADHALTFGLIWLDYLRRGEPRRHVEGLALFLPLGHEGNTLLRLRALDAAAARWAVFRYDETGFEQEADLDDTGNLFEALTPWRSSAPFSESQAEAWARHLGTVEGVEAVELGSSARSLRVRGLEFARIENESLLVGIDRKRPAQSLEEGLQLASALSAIRVPGSPQPAHAWFLRQPERWLESGVRANLQIVDASLEASPVYGQVGAMAGLDRGIVDLLAIDYRNRLAGMELKASEDPHLPLQALDYWIRLKHHAAQSAFTALGYFPGRAVLAEAPRLLLVAPALEFHPATETLLGFFASEVQVERIGLGVEWQGSIRVVLRARGAARFDLA